MRAWVFINADSETEATAQEQFVKERCIQNGIQVVGSDDLAKYDGNIHKAVANVYNNALNHNCDIIAAMNLSRFGLDMERTIPLLKILCDAGLKVFSATEGMLNECHIESYALHFSNKKI